MRTYVKQEAFIGHDTYLHLSRNKFFETVYLDDKLFQLAIQFYNEYFGYKEHKITTEEAIHYAELGVRINADLWKSLMPMDEVKMNFFYSITPFYFFHDIVRFMDGMHREIGADFMRTKFDTCLDFAGGTGGFTIFLSMNGRKVDYYDSNKLQLAWMKFAKEKLKLPFNIIDSPENIKGPYDFIIAKDIAEHVVDPGNLRNWLISNLSETGKIYITQIPCCGPEELAPMHFKIDSKDDVFQFDIEENMKTLCRPLNSHL